MDFPKQIQQNLDPGLKEPDGPTTWPGFNVFRLWRDVLGYLSSIRTRYGDIARINLMRTNLYLVSHPDLINQVFREEKSAQSKIAKSFFYRAFKPAFGDGIFNSDGNQWEVQRKLLQPHFQKSAVKKWFPIIVDESLNRFRRIAERPQHEYDLVKEILPLVQGIMSKCLFDRPLDDQAAKDCVEAIQVVSERMPQRAYASFVLNGILNTLPTPGNRRLKKALKTIDRTLEKMRQTCHDQPNDTSFFAILAGQVNHRELRDQLFTLFFAGQDTSINAIVWTLYYVSLNPEVEQRLRSEIEAVLSQHESLTYDALEALVYTKCVVSESMRLAPPAYAMYRDTVDKFELDATAIKSDSLITLCPYITHRHPDYWDNPDQFDPDRFVRTPHPPKYAYFPFGGGKRICLGQQFAMMEIVTVVALFVASFRFTLLQQPSVVQVPNMTLQPKYGVPVRLESTRYFDPVKGG